MIIGKYFMKDLGIYRTKNNETYCCYFILETKRVFVVGPFTKNVFTSSYIVEEILADSEEEAKNKLIKDLGEGSFL